MVKPGGTGSPRLAISARPAPLPPSRFFISARPSALPPPKAKTHLPLGARACAQLRAGALRVDALRADTFRAGDLRAGARRCGLAADLRDRVFAGICSSIWVMKSGL